MLTTPPKWTDRRLAQDSRAAVELFREVRMTEPLELYSAFFEEAKVAVEAVLEATTCLLDLANAGPELLLNRSSSEVLRYLAGPPISEADLMTIAEIKLSRSSFAKDPMQFARALETVLLGLDRNRFPWVLESEEPSDAEYMAAVTATASLIAQRKVLTARANDGKTQQENRVKAALVSSGFTEVATRTIPTLVQAPLRGEFCGESLLGSRKADVVVRLWDDRVLAVECKVSNSGTNSVKRLNNDAAVKAVAWVGEFGTAQLVPSAMLAGVFNERNLASAQDRGLTLWWSHDLVSFLNWIESTR